MTAKKVKQTGDAGLWRKAAALNFTGLGPTVFDQLVADKKLPQPVKVYDDYIDKEGKLHTARALGWVPDEMVAWRKERIAARDAQRDEPKTTKPKRLPKRSEKG
jgi:predicted DNA-binding transcriptional regulator AlpA